VKLLLFPLDIEFKAFVSALESLGFESEKMLVERLPVYTFKKLSFRCSLGGHGKVQFAVQTQFLLNQFTDVKQVFCLGTSGALVESVKPLDVVVATETVEHDFNLKFIKRDKPCFRSDAVLLEAFKGLKTDGFGLHFGPVASGDEDVLCSERSAAIHKDTGALVTAWEGVGGARVCKFLSYPYIEIRAVSDTADGAAAKDFKENLSKSMANIASLMLRLP